MKLEPLRQKLREQQRALPEAFEAPPKVGSLNSFNWPTSMTKARIVLLKRLFRNVVAKNGIRPVKMQRELHFNLIELRSLGLVKLEGDLYKTTGLWSLE